MPKEADNPEESRRPRSPRRIVRWLLRFLGWSAVVAAFGIVLVALVAWFAYQNRVKIVNDALAFFVQPFEVSVDEIDLYPIGEVRVKNLRLSPRKSSLETPLLAIPEVEASYRFPELRQERQLRTLVLRRPHLHFDRETLEAIRAAPRAPTTPQAPFDLGAIIQLREFFTVEDGTFHVDLDATPPVSGEWSLETGPFLFDANGYLVQPLELALANIGIGEDAALGTIPGLAARGRVRRDLGFVDIESLEVEGFEAEITPEWLPSAKEGPGSPKSPQDPAATPPALRIGSLRIGESSLEVTGFDGEAYPLAVPDLAFETSIELDGIEFTEGRWSSVSPLSLVFRDVAAGTPLDALDRRLVSAEEISLRASSLGEAIHDSRIGELSLEGVDVLLSEETLSRLRANPPDPESGSDPGRVPPTWIVESLRVERGSFLMRDNAFPGQSVPHVEAEITARLQDLRLGGEKGFDSAGEQALRLDRARVRAPGATESPEPLLAFDSAELEGRWDEFDFDGRIRRLLVESPSITFTDEALGGWIDPPPPGEEKPAGPANRPVIKVDDLSVRNGRLVADSRFADQRVPKIRSGFSIETDSTDAVDPHSYRIRFEDFRLRNHAVQVEAGGNDAEPDPAAPASNEPGPDAAQPVAEEPVITIREIEVTATASQLQRSRRIGRVRVSGGILHVGEGLRSIIETGAEAKDGEPEESPPGPGQARSEQAGGQAANLPTWTLEEVEITQSQVRFERLIPQVEGLEFAVETILSDVPLSPDELLSREKLQKIELAGLEIKDPYDSFITVAFLPTVFVEFSLAGLARQEVERVDLIAPALHVGQGLFWWVDYQRNFRAQNEGALVGFENGGPVAPAGDEPPDWTIKTINATAGKIVIAPTGIPIGMVPFPFNATTNMEDGRIELKLNIPDEEYVYRFPDYKVDLYGLTGDVQFNVPIEQVSNNLVQTFSLDRIVWKDYEAEKLYLTVTFDEYGIYGKLGGDAYEGYIEAGFNFYLEDTGKWDAWVAGTGIAAGPLTKVLSPQTFRMDGPVNLEVISEGRKKQFGETTLDFETTGPGWYDISKLNQVFETLPADWSNLQTSLAELGLVALKRFDYDKGTGSLYLLGRDGTLDLEFTGPYGSRNLNIHLHDQRNGTTTADAAVASGRQPPLPEAAARPVADRR